MAEQCKAGSTQGLAERPMDVTERRRTKRFEAAFDVSISMAKDSTRGMAIDAWVRNVSANGLGISCPEAFDVGDTVTVRAPGKSMQCEVRHCVADGAMFSIGLEVLTSSDGTDIQLSLRDLSRALHFSDRTSHSRPPAG